MSDKRSIVQVMTEMAAMVVLRREKVDLIHI